MPETHPEPHVPTDALHARVRSLAKVKTSQGSLAKELGIGLTEFRRHYVEDWDAGREEAKQALITKLLAQGMAGNTNAAMKYMIAMGMVAPTPKRIEHTGKDGGPIQTVDLSRLSAEDLELYGRLAARSEGLDPDAIIIENVHPPA